MDGMGGGQRARAIVIDAHPIVRTGLAVVLAQHGMLDVIASVASVHEVLERGDAGAADIAIVDPAVRDGIAPDLLHGLRDSVDGRILAFSVIEEPARVAEVLRGGAIGFVLKTQPVSEIVHAVLCTLNGRRYLPPSLRDSVEPLADSPSPLPLERLTRREREVLALLLRGLSNDEAASKLFISPRTVDTHRHRIMSKLDAHSLADLVRLAARLGLLD